MPQNSLALGKHCSHANLLVLSFGNILSTDQEGGGEEVGWGGGEDARSQSRYHSDCPTGPCRRGGRAWRTSKHNLGGEGGGDEGD